MTTPSETTILLVEDIEPYRAYVKQLLREFGYSTVLEASDGQAALKILLSRKPDLVISDFCMQHLSGLELLRATRAMNGLKEVPFLMITAVGDDATVAQAERHGVTLYLRKPLHIELFRESVSNALNGTVAVDLSEKYRHLRP